MTSNFDIQHIFGRSVEEIDDIIANIDKHVKRFSVPKKDGSRREIIAPDDTLKFIQRRLIYMIFSNYKPNGNSHGFIVRRNIVTNAQNHVGAKSLGHLDIKSFFDTISENNIKNCIFGNERICKMCRHYDKYIDGKCNPSLYKNSDSTFPHKCEELKAVMVPGYCEKRQYQSLFKRIIGICMLNGHTPQGFPTSPYIANIVMRGFDIKMSRLASDNECVYTRYADDLSFSSKKHNAEELRLLFKEPAQRTLFGFGFKVNHEKEQWKNCGGRLSVCGIVVNKKPNIRRSIIRLFRAKVHKATVKCADRVTRKRIKQLKGWASFLMSVNPDQGKKYMNMLTSFETKKWKQAA